MKGRVFLLEDDTSICGLIQVALEMQGMELQAFSSVREFTRALQQERPDVALLDIMLPDGSGLDVLHCIKSLYPDVRCIMLSALSKEEDKVNGLNRGADDYVSKPFSVLELTARVNAQLRHCAAPAELRADGITVYPETMTASLDGTPLTLNKKEFALLRYFVENKGIVLPREKILTAVWGYDTGETRTLDNHVARLRKMGVKIETVFGVGYKL